MVSLAREITIRLREDTGALAAEAVRQGTGKKTLFFCRRRSLAEAVAERMRGDELGVFVHHSSVSLEERQAAEARFAGGINACIVCTSTLELGIDVGDLDLVFQANAPSTVSSFLQQITRSATPSAAGSARRLPGGLVDSRRAARASAAPACAAPRDACL
jgi:ATP-dependent Lhr-like helicase